MQVFGGTVNCGEGALVVETSVDAAGSAIARMAALVEQACAAAVLSTSLLDHLRAGRALQEDTTTYAYITARAMLCL